MLLGSAAELVVAVLFVTTIFGLIKYQQYPERVFGLLLLTLYFLGLVTTDQVLSSFANPGLLTLVLLMVCSLALEKPSCYALSQPTLLNPVTETLGFVFLV
ncbi:sulfate permease Trk-type [Vibrio astriarenae]|nr:sulfate permease Trk-type [Vibrio sp. C7]